MNAVVARKTQFVITGEPQHMKSKSVIKANKYNVISADWLVDSGKALAVLPMLASVLFIFDSFFNV